jgi:effector-binding domain-containing protein
MYKIGEFSKLSRVPIKTLRYYHEIGLLEPAGIDNFTGYRFYRAEQLFRLNQILALKDLGFSLEEVRKMLGNAVSAQEIHGMLRLKQAELEAHVTEEQARLGRVASRLKQMSQEHDMPDYEMVIKEVETVTVAGYRGIAATYNSVGPFYERLFGALGQQSIHPIGAPMAIYYDEEYKEEDVDVETAVPVRPNTQITHPIINIRELPGCEMACVIHRGAYNNFSAAYQAMMAWISANCYHIIGPNREIYLKGPGIDVDPTSYVTEIQVPVSKRS